MSIHIPNVRAEPGQVELMVLNSGNHPGVQQPASPRCSLDNIPSMRMESFESPGGKNRELSEGLCPQLSRRIYVMREGNPGIDCS